jgi:RecB family exonuclease
MKLSYTALHTFQQCRFHFHLRYHRGLPSRPHPSARSSRALHGALHLFHRGLQQHYQEGAALPLPEAGSLATLLAHFQGYADNLLRPLTDEQVREGQALLTRYWEAHRGQFPPPYLLEEKFTVHVGPFLLTGRIDRIDATSAGYEILDYKLSQRSVVAPDPLQLDVYQLGFQALSGRAASQVSFYYLRSGQKETVEADPPLAARARVRAVCGEISRERAFAPQAGGWCARCEFQEFCPAKARRPRALPVQSKLQQLGFDFDA